ncbi:methylated-DNA--[protein]-cysteine S-methyltransferase [Streptomyces sp. LHD-70]|uniref:methylated-DNA--[protein]-cysteine S-methyltransferase n=1 Tax=Streptomyces sp. LHD-70 TaxID=3072140 RepID=UPI00280CC061|nr:methylated-DNA--[protein]-cysteine S-methyltransferase [Streptomyces sp. LHD-70]MDQ8706929.1 methylated-DNA--[protein]-cysteine S-methyltransferase [Streptomyces sp. LHD-70]
MTLYTTVDSPVGELLLVGEESPGAPGRAALVSLSMPGQRGAPRVEPGWRRAPEAFDAAVQQLRAYFDGELTEFRLEFSTRGSAFQERVWQALDAIPYGTTTTYGALAERLGVGREEVRAVGAAIGANPLLLVRPCHRVIGADGSMRGYAAGIPRKEALLTHEGALQPQLELPL